MDFRVFSRNISENMHARCVREDTKQALKGNLQADGVQSRQAGFVRCCLIWQLSNTPDHFQNCSAIGIPSVPRSFPHRETKQADP